MVNLSISDVRAALRRHYDGADDVSAAERSTAQLGRIFHQAFAALMSNDPVSGWQAALEEHSLGDCEKLAAHVYDRLVGPALTAQQAALQERGEQVLALWQAVREMSAWVSRLLTAAEREGRLTFDRKRDVWRGADALCLVDQPLAIELRDPEWTAPVRISGIADAIWKNPETGRWCVAEYKLGQANPSVDLAQVCLYHEMLAASGVGDGGGIALVSFRPQLEERFFESGQIQTAQQKLHKLIGALAGVTSHQPPPVSEPTSGAAEMGKRIVQELAQFGVTVSLVDEPIVGPAFVRYTIMPARGVRTAAVTSKEEDLQIHLRLENAPLIRKHKGRLVIDVQREHPEPVLFASIEDKLVLTKAGSSKIILGVDLLGQLQTADISQSTCPHLLVAGTAGSGKSEWMRTAIAGLLKTNTPETLRLVLIDPKYSAFEDLAASPFLYRDWGVLHPTENSIVDALDVLIDEMETRNKAFKESRASDLAEHVALTGDVIPRIVCVCDEYADLIADKKTRPEIESRIARLGAKARSSGIHLIIATQFPKANVVTSVLKANLSGRVCLRVTDRTQSQVVLGTSGAQRLLGKGDLLFLDIGEPVRLQAVYLPPAERARIFQRL